MANENVDYKRVVEQVLLRFIDRELACIEEVKDMDKKHIVSMLDEIAKDVGYWDFALEHKIFIN